MILKLVNLYISAFMFEMPSGDLKTKKEDVQEIREIIIKMVQL